MKCKKCKLEIKSKKELAIDYSWSGKLSFIRSYHKNCFKQDVGMVGGSIAVDYNQLSKIKSQNYLFIGLIIFFAAISEYFFYKNNELSANTVYSTTIFLFFLFLVVVIWPLRNIKIINDINKMQ